MKKFEIVGKPELNCGLSVRGTEDGDLIIFSSGQDIVRISELSDENTINLFLYPLGKGEHKSHIIDDSRFGKERHQILVQRTRKSKKIFGEGPLYQSV